MTRHKAQALNFCISAIQHQEKSLEPQAAIKIVQQIFAFNRFCASKRWDLRDVVPPVDLLLSTADSEAIVGWVSTLNSTLYTFKKSTSISFLSNYIEPYLHLLEGIGFDFSKLSAIIADFQKAMTSDEQSEILKREATLGEILKAIESVLSSNKQFGVFTSEWKETAGNHLLSMSPSDFFEVTKQLKVEEKYKKTHAKSLGGLAFLFDLVSILRLGEEGVSNFLAKLSQIMIFLRKIHLLPELY